MRPSFLALSLATLFGGCDIPDPPDGSITCSYTEHACPDDARNPGKKMICCQELDNRCYHGDQCPAPAKSPTCGDGIKNGSETDIDCGGVSCNRCALGMSCTNDADCDANSGMPNQVSFCADETYRCTRLIDPCSDGVMDWKETDVDCGGLGGCSPCLNGKKCLVPSDCKSKVCSTNICVGLMDEAPQPLWYEEATKPWYMRPLKRLTDEDFRIQPGFHEYLEDPYKGINEKDRPKSAA